MPLTINGIPYHGMTIEDYAAEQVWIITSKAMQDATVSRHFAMTVNWNEVRKLMEMVWIEGYKAAGGKS